MYRCQDNATFPPTPSLTNDQAECGVVVEMEELERE